MSGYSWWDSSAGENGCKTSLIVNFDPSLMSYPNFMEVNVIIQLWAKDSPQDIQWFYLSEVLGTFFDLQLLADLASDLLLDLVQLLLNHGVGQFQVVSQTQSLRHQLAPGIPLKEDNRGGGGGKKEEMRGRCGMYLRRGQQGRKRRDDRERGGEDMQSSVTQSTSRPALFERQLTNRTYQCKRKTAEAINTHKKKNAFPFCHECQLTAVRKR